MQAVSSIVDYLSARKLCFRDVTAVATPETVVWTHILTLNVDKGYFPTLSWLVHRSIDCRASAHRLRLQTWFQHASKTLPPMKLEQGVGMVRVEKGDDVAAVLEVVGLLC